MRTPYKLLSALALSLVTFASSVAAPVSTTAYDVTNTSTSGFGAWQHQYSGTIVSNGGGRFNYTGGSGTLNDGVVGTGVGNTHLFEIGAKPSITLYFDSLFTLNTLSLYSFGPTANGIPGNITGLFVTIGSASQYLQTTGFGPSNAAFANNGFDHSHELINFTGTSLAGIATNQVTLSGFTTAGNYTGYFSISEVALDGTAAQVSEPGALVLGSFALLAAWGVRRRRAAV